MLLIKLLFTASVATAFGLAPAPRASFNQATRAQVEARAAYRALARKMGRRAEPATGSQTCSEDATIPAANGGGCCPANEKFLLYLAVGGDTAHAPGCCAEDKTYGCNDFENCCDGTVYNSAYACCPTGQTVYFRGLDCCEGTVYNNGMSCCPPDFSLEKDGDTETCVVPLPDAIPDGPIGERSLSAAPPVPLEYKMLKRDGHRTLLDAELAARYLLNEGEFSHENTLYVDEEYKRDNQEQWLKVFKRGSVHLISFAKRSSWLNARFSKMYVREEQALSVNYKFRTADVPAIMEHLKKDFKPFEWRGISFDKQTVFALASFAPNFNSTGFEDWQK